MSRYTPSSPSRRSLPRHIAVRAAFARGVSLCLLAGLFTSLPAQALSLLDENPELNAPAETSAGAPPPPSPPDTVDTTMTAANVDPAANPLLGETWNRRSLVLVAPDEQDRELERQRDELRATRGEMQQRDVTLYTLMGTRGIHDGVPMSFEEVRALRDAMQLREGAPFTVILIGKDGGKKMQLEGFVAPDQIYQVIDSMPMRQREAGEATRQTSSGSEEHTSPAPLDDEDWQWDE
ncbi:DUF4174 domain-containing protein [Cobetia sp. MMG027]|uniref:DUF4174 domain-containing protein n=1 Tax=Cobetia sp. MMG027 TaxID=3021980 RepID=UPI0022FEBE66|nr:DUF4174 domain-containing protein [Cobetia sp. MMG027]MDA5563051.1 DUF4174 domain-containing protein [Cobetia sp. MMG027]